MRGTVRLLVAASLLTFTLASAGDRSRDFKNCVNGCMKRGCDPLALPPTIKMTGWTCLDDCRYWCMHELTDRAIESGTRIFQYYGKWPFWRFLGMQEPASVAFSVFNLLAHIEGASFLQREIAPGHPMRKFYMLWSFTSMNAWVWSAVFHTRDKPLTEKLDYFAAALTILFALYFTVIRLFHLYPQPQRNRLTSSPFAPSRKPFTFILWTLLCSVALIAHVSYLSLLPRFDYTYNMAFGLAIGMTHNLLWLIFSLPSNWSLIHRFPSQPKFYRPPFVGRAAILVVCTTAVTFFEVLDFPPLWRIIDAHSLWHLSTALIAPFWYQFLVDDSHDPSWREYIQ